MRTIAVAEKGKLPNSYTMCINCLKCNRDNSFQTNQRLKLFEALGSNPLRPDHCGIVAKGLLLKNHIIKLWVA